VLSIYPIWQFTSRQFRVPRVDCSAKSSNGFALNDSLLTGANLQEGLLDILCRFRTYRFVIAADITKMYRMIEINSEDTDFLRILWRDNLNDSIETYRLKTLIFGLTCAPFLAIRCLKQLALDTQQSHPSASTVINRDFYMDDLLTGSNSIDEAVQIKSQVTNILATGLCCWGYPQPICPKGVRPHRCASSVSTLSLIVHSRGRAPARPMGFPPPLVPHINCEPRPRLPTERWDWVVCRNALWVNRLWSAIYPYHSWGLDRSLPRPLLARRQERCYTAHRFPKREPLQCLTRIGPQAIAITTLFHLVVLGFALSLLRGAVCSPSSKVGDLRPPTPVHLSGTSSDERSR
jgi:hypothetical protein